MKPLCPFLVLLALSACAESAPKEERKAESASREPIEVQASVVADTVSYEPVEVQAPAAKSVVAHEERFASTHEAYNEGYCNGEQEGYTDAINDLDFGYSYNAEPEYSGYLQAYINGYYDGYRDGYNDGLEWAADNK